MANLSAPPPPVQPTSSQMGWKNKFPKRNPWADHGSGSAAMDEDAAIAIIERIKATRRPVTYFIYRDNERPYWKDFAAEVGSIWKS